MAENEINRPWVISPAPHIHGNDSISRNMLLVITALLPAWLVGLYFFGMGALIVSLVSIAACVLTEYLIQKYLLKGELTIKDGSAVLTGLLLAMNLPSNLPVWIVVLGAVFAIGVAKMSFGGIGNNPFNPALAGRVFLLISFPAAMTTWPVVKPLSTAYLDAETCATPLSMMKDAIRTGDFAQVHLPSITDMFIGKMPGSIGEVSAVALLLGFALLLITKVIRWHIPVSILLTVFVFSEILFWANPVRYTEPLIHLLAGGLLLGAIFMATDYSTSPMHPRGMWIYGIGIGLLTVIIRNFGTYPEGVSFAILIMNGFTPLINATVKPKRFAGKRE